MRETKISQVKMPEPRGEKFIFPRLIDFGDYTILMTMVGIFITIVVASKFL